MEQLLKKYQSKYKRVRDEMGRWEQLQSRFMGQFGNASAIIGRLPVLQDLINYGVLNNIPDMKSKLPSKQFESLGLILSTMCDTMQEFHSVVKALEKISQDGNLLLKEEKPLSSEQMDLRVGLGPTLRECLDGLQAIYEMHLFEYQLKSAAISCTDWKSSATDLEDLCHLLNDQPNIPKDQVELIINKIFAEDMNWVSV